MLVYASTYIGGSYYHNHKLYSYDTYDDYEYCNGANITTVSTVGSSI